MRRILAALGAAALLGTTAAPAQDVFDWDGDSDSLLDRDEFEAGYDELSLFEMFDTDSDGGIGPAEIAGVRYATMDLDGDGQLTVAEWDTWIDRRVGEAEVALSPGDWDENGDGVISRAEYDAEVARRGMFSDLAGGDDGAFDADEFRTGLFDDLDADGDGRLGEDEFPADGFAL